MSRGFVREDDQEEAPFVPPRAPLPDGVTNYVTERGLQRLHAEREQLEAERSSLQGNDDERRRAQVIINGRLDLLNERIASARVVVPETGADDVRFGTTVELLVVIKGRTENRRRFTIVGVDEASVADERIAFTAPIARALIGKKVGAVVEFMPGPQPQRLTVITITQNGPLPANA